MKHLLPILFTLLIVKQFTPVPDSLTTTTIPAGEEVMIVWGGGQWSEHVAVGGEETFRQSGCPLVGEIVLEIR